MVYNNVAIAESFKKSYGLNSLLQKRVTLKEEGGGVGRDGSVQKIGKYRNIALRNRRNTDTSSIAMIGHSSLFNVVFRGVYCIDLY